MVVSTIHRNNHEMVTALAQPEFNEGRTRLLKCAIKGKTVCEKTCNSSANEYFALNFIKKKLFLNKMIDFQFHFNFQVQRTKWKSGVSVAEPMKEQSLRKTETSSGCEQLLCCRVFCFEFSFLKNYYWIRLLILSFFLIFRYSGKTGRAVSAHQTNGRAKSA